MENYYEILHVANFAEIEVVKASYKAMTKLYHPDMNKNVDQNVMIKINLAYEIIGNIEKKKVYDIELKKYLNMQNKYDYNHNSFQENVDSSKTVCKTTKTGKFTKAFVNSMSFVAEVFVNSFFEVKKNVENAYYKGITLNDEQLIKKYLRSSGYERNGYAQALIDRGLLYKEGERLIPSYTFEQIAKYL